MADSPRDKRVVISPDPAHLAASVSARFLDRVATLTRRQDAVHVVLTGGTIGTAVLRAAGEDPRRHEVEWTRVHFWWGDERFVARDSDERNERVAREAFLDHIAVPPANVHAMAATGEGVDLDEGAAQYAAALAAHGDGDQAWPNFDICFLGVGPDGHIASLFPERSAIQVTDRAVVPVRHSPKPPPERLSLTRPVINSSERVWLVVAGQDKAAALGLAVAGASYERVPAAGAKGRRRTLFFADEAAAAQVPAELTRD